MREQIELARAEAARCDLPQAIAAMQGALEQADREWPAGHEGFFILHHDLATWLTERFRFAEAEAHARTALSTIRAARGEADPLYARAAQTLGVALAGRQRFTEAEPLIQAAASIFTARGDTTGELQALLALSGLESARGRSAQALAYADRAAALLPVAVQQGQPVARAAALRIAEAERRMLRFTDAAAALNQAEAIGQSDGAGQRRLLLAKASLAFEAGDLRGALDLLQAAERAPLDPCDRLVDPDIAARRATIHLIARDVSEARLSFAEALARLEAMGLADSPRYAEALAGLATATGLAGEFDASDQLFVRAIAAMRKAYGGTTSAEAQVTLEHAYMLAAADRLGEAIPLAEQARDILDGPVDQQPLDRAYAAAVLGQALKDAGRIAEAEPLLQEALAAFALQRGEDSFDLVPGLVALGEVRLQQGRLDEAEAYLQRALRIQQQGGWSGAQMLGVTRSRLAAVYQARGQADLALAESERAVRVLEQRIALGEQKPWADIETERRRARAIVEYDLALAVAAMPGEGKEAQRRKADRLLLAGQLGASLRTGEAIAQMADRLALGGGETGMLVRERQDLVVRFRAAQEDQLASLIRARAGDGADRGAPADLGSIAARLQAIDQRLDREDRKASIVLKSPVAGLAEVQAQLGPDEVMLAFFVGDDATIVVAITAEDCLSYRSSLGRADLAEGVRTVRAALDPSDWPSSIPPAFPAALAYSLWNELVAPAAPLLAGRTHLIAVPDGPLMSLPLGVLLTRPIDDEGDADLDTYRTAPWLVREHAISVLPSVAAFTTLRSIGPLPAAGTEFLGVGAPVVTGALESQLRPLPGAEAELSQIAALFDSAHATVRLRADAREDWLRERPLERFATIAFATHGLVAGDLAGYDEPALVLSSPGSPSPDDDGVLTASEVAALRLDANWVILSACSTAASDGRPEAEPFTGLVKAFFYAGARALLATNWPVDSHAAASIATRTLANARSGASRASALQKAQLAIIDDQDQTGRTHPVFWASYNLVGPD